jgi:hypothetical protein
MAAGRARRGGIALVVVLAVVAGLVVGGRALWNAARKATASNGCDYGSYNLTLSRAQNASTMVAVVIKRNLPERAAVLVLGAAMQESKLDNIPDGAGDRDSVGILQQRPSQGWGSAEQLANVAYATGKFLDAVVKVPNWQNDSLATVIQTVQVSADGSAYAKHEPQAQTVADALMGVTAAGVTCRFDQPSVIATPAAMAAQLAKELPVHAPSTSGKTVSVSGASWATAAWFVGHASVLGIDEVRYSGQHWKRSKGWSADTQAGATAVTATLAG